MQAFQIFTTQHIPAALKLWRATENIGLSSADEPDALARFLDRNPGFSFVALESGVLAGTILCGHDGRRGYLYHLAVALPSRKSGLGARLVSLCLERLSAAKIFKCHAFVFHHNPYGELFWAPQGWEYREDLRVYSRLTSPGD